MRGSSPHKWRDAGFKKACFGPSEKGKKKTLHDDVDFQ